MNGCCFEVFPDTARASAGKSEDVKLLLEAGAKDVANSESITALEAASKNGHAACVELLQNGTGAGT